MKITWLGQAGLFMETDELTVMIDPYFSDSVGKTDPNKHRRKPVDEKWLTRIPDVLILTHNHTDHSDPETLRVLLGSEKKVTVLAPQAAWESVRKNGGGHNYVLFNRHTEYTIGNLRFRAVKAEHSDPHPIGVLLFAEGKTLYITGDTLYNTDIFPDIPPSPDVVFLPVNGAGNNMNMADARRFCRRIGAKMAVPLHCGLFDDINMHGFDVTAAVIPEYFKEIPLWKKGE